MRKKVKKKLFNSILILEDTWVHAYMNTYIYKNHVNVLKRIILLVIYFFINLLVCTDAVGGEEESEHQSEQCGQND